MQNKKLSKQEFIEKVISKTGLTKSDTSKTLDAILDVITESLIKKMDIAFTGFGTFSTSQREARTGRNPSNGKEIQIPAKTVPTFKAGKGLKERVEGN